MSKVVGGTADVAASCRRYDFMISFNDFQKSKLKVKWEKHGKSQQSLRESWSWCERVAQLSQNIVDNTPQTRAKQKMIQRSRKRERKRQWRNQLVFPCLDGWVLKNFKIAFWMFLINSHFFFAPLCVAGCRTAVFVFQDYKQRVHRRRRAARINRKSFFFRVRKCIFESRSWTSEPEKWATCAHTNKRMKKNSVFFCPDQDVHRFRHTIFA